MLKMTRLVFLALVLVFCWSCSKAPEAAEESAEEETELAEEIRVPHGVLLTDAGLWEVRSDGKIYWKSQLNAGDTVIWTGEQQNYRRNYDNEERTFFRVNADGDFWVQDYAIAGPAEPAVVIAADTVLYTKPDLTSPARTGNIVLPRYTLVAVLQDENGGNGDFVQISARLEGTSNPPVNDRYIKVQNLSIDPNDIGCVKLVRIAAATENPVVRAELLNNALIMAQQSRSLSQTALDLDNDPALFELELTDNLERLANQVNYLVTAETVNVRSMPSITAAVSGTLNQGDTVWITVKTKRELVLDAAEGEEKPRGAWYRTEQGGWIFGAYIVPNPLYN